jgi:hypothetical protein
MRVLLANKMLIQCISNRNNNEKSWQIHSEWFHFLKKQCNDATKKILMPAKVPGNIILAITSIFLAPGR